MATKTSTARVVTGVIMPPAPPPLQPGAERLNPSERRHGGRFTRSARSTFLLSAIKSGDRLRRAEFERRYEAMPGVKKAELIEGVVYSDAAA